MRADEIACRGWQYGFIWLYFRSGMVFVPLSFLLWRGVRFRFPVVGRVEVSRVSGYAVIGIGRIKLF